MNKTIISRKELFDLVWEKPVTQIAEKHQIPANVIRKTCHKNKIPVPPNGYWQKKRYNKEIPPKPKLQKNVDETIIFDSEKYKYRALDNDSKNSKKKIKPHKQIAEVHAYLKKAKPTSEYDRYPGILRSINNMLDFDVTPRNLNRAIKIFNNFIYQLEKRNHSIHVDHGTYVKVFGEKIHIRLKEKFRSIDVKGKYGYTNRNYKPSGILAFVVDLRAYHHPDWPDKPNSPLELKIPNIINYLEEHAKSEIKYRIESEKRRKIEEENRKRAEELRKQKENELDKFRALLRHSLHWRQAQVIREYLKAQEQNLSLTDENSHWLTWAKHKVDWFDPFTQAQDEILNDEDREQLIKELNEIRTKNYLF